MTEPDKVGEKLTMIAQLAEELSAEVFSDSPETAKKFGKIGAYCRRIAVCVRLHGQVPLEKPKHAVTRALRSLDRIAKTVQTVCDQLPRGDDNE